MEYKHLKNIIIIFLFSILLLTSLVNASNYNIKLLDKNYQITAIEEKGAQTGVYYNIMITLENEGPDKSDNITITVLDEYDLPINKNYTFNSSEIKTFIFNDYPVIGEGSHEIRIEYYPTNESLSNPSNTGSDIMTLTYNKEGENTTPSIQFFILIFTILSISYIWKRNRK